MIDSELQKNSGRSQERPVPGKTAVPESQDSGRKLFYGLFIFPLLIAVGMAVLLCTVVLLTREVETPETLISAIKTGSPSKRWQKAFELANEINQGRGLIRQTGVMKEIIHILNDRAGYDAKTRSYMAMALARFNEPEAGEALRARLKTEEDADVQVYLIWALGAKKSGAAAEEIIPFLKRPQEDLRKMAAYALGNLGNPKAISALEPLLSDSARDVRWNTALSLARLGSRAGYDEIVKMLDREALRSYHQVPADKVEEIMVNGVRGLAVLRDPEALPLLADLSNHDPSLKVRQAAIEAIKYQKSQSSP